MSDNWVSYIKRHGKPAMRSWHEDGVLKLYTTGEGQKDTLLQLSTAGQGTKVNGRPANLDPKSPQKLREGQNQEWILRDTFGMSRVRWNQDPLHVG